MMFRSLCVFVLASVTAQAALLPEARAPSTPARAAVLPRGSQGCTTTAACPGQDQAGFSLGTHSDSSGILFCSYPAFPGENPNDFYCTYNDMSGALITDNDAGFCSGSAPITATCARSVLPADSIVRAFDEDMERRKLKPKTKIPGYMDVRSKLADRKAKRAYIAAELE